MSPAEHIEAAEASLEKADGMDDALCASAEAQIAQVHLLVAGLKLVNGLLSKNRRPADMVGMGLSILKLAK